MKSQTAESAWPGTETTKPAEGNCRPGGSRAGKPCFPFEPAPRPVPRPTELQSAFGGPCLGLVSVWRCPPAILKLES